MQIDPTGTVEGQHGEARSDSASHELSFRRRWGLVAALKRSLVQRLARVLGIRIYGIFMRSIGPVAEQDPIVTGFSFRVYERGDEAELLAAAVRPELGLTSTFIAAAFAKGDVCEAALRNGEIVSFAWSAFTPTHCHDGVFIRFDERARYSYFAYTLPAYRGRHLFLQFNPARDRYVAARGCTTSVAYISIDNKPSIARSLAAGNQRIGLAGYFRKGPFFLPIHSRAVKDAGVRFFMPDTSDSAQG